MKDFKEQNPVAGPLDIDYCFVLIDVAHNAPRQTAHALQEPCTDRYCLRITCLANRIGGGGVGLGGAAPWLCYYR